MARPISKYFTSVIRKIMEAKHAENIVVDQKFKASLRQQIVARIEGLDGRSEGFDVDGFADSVTEFFRKWKYQLALVPVAFVMVLVAAQSFKMPVNVKSEVVVPSGMESVQSEKVTEKNITVEPEQADAPVDSQTNIAGTAVDSTLPAPVAAGQVSGDEQGLPPTSATYAVGQVNDESPKNLVVPAEAVPQSAVPAKSVQNKTAPDSSGPASQKNLVVAGTYILPKTVATPAGATQVVKSAKKPGTAAGDVPPELLNQTEPSSLIVLPPAVSIEPIGGGESVVTVGNVQTIVSQDLAAPVAADTGSLQTVAPTAVAPAAVAPPQTAVTSLPTESLPAPVSAVVSRTVDGVKLVEVAAPPMPEIVLPIYYEQTFEEDLKPEFEEKILADLVKGKDFTLASVSKGTDDVVTVELFLKDGSSEKKLYLKNVRTGVWNEVQYVQRYFYDDSLEYVRTSSPSYRPYPGTFYPYQSPYLNR